MSRSVRFIIGLMCGLSVGVGPAAADPPPNANNCAGVLASGMTEFVSEPPGDFGRLFVRSQAQAGQRDDFAAGFTEILASCGTP